MMDDARAWASVLAVEGSACMQDRLPGSPAMRGAAMRDATRRSPACPPVFSVALGSTVLAVPVIKGQFLKVLDHHFHADCWKCGECATTLKAENCAVDAGEFYCKTCMIKRRAAAPVASQPKQVQQQMGSNPQAVPSGAAVPAGGSDAAATEKAAAALAAIRARQAAEAEASAAAAAAPAGSSGAAPAYSDPASTVYPYALLKDKAARPADVDPARKERYLSDEEFATLFKMDKAAFAKLPEWKQKAQKTPLMLF